MADTEAEAKRKKSLHEQFGEVAKAQKGETGDKAGSKSEKGSKSKKKTPADRYAEEGEVGGRRTKGPPGTGDFLGVKRAAKTKPKVDKPDQLAEAVMAEADIPPPLPVRKPGMKPGVPPVGGSDMAGVPLSPPPPGGQDPITMLLEALRQIPMFGFSRMTPEINRAGPLTAGSVAPFSNPFGSMRPPVGPMQPGGVSMQGATAKPTTAPVRKVKTETISPAEGESKPKAKESVAKESKPKKKAEKKAKPKSSADRLGDRMMKDDRGSSDYYEQMKQGRFRLG